MKVFTFILNNRLSVWCEENQVIDESQAGFRKQYSTIDNIFTLTSVVQKYLSRPGGRFYCIFIDFSKAFDSIQHELLWNTLRRKSISGRFLKVLQSLYKNLKACIRVDDGLSNFFNCNVGTRQGCLISPLIFCLFINDLVDYMKAKFPNGVFINANICDLYALMYADDISSMSDTAIQLQRQINCISQYCNEVKMQINLDKTKIIVFRNGGHLKSMKNGILKIRLLRSFHFIHIWAFT